MGILEKYREDRKSKKISQKEMSAYLEISRKSLYFYENSIRDVPYEIMKRYMERLGYRILFINKNDIA